MDVVLVAAMIICAIYPSATWFCIAAGFGSLAFLVIRRHLRRPAPAARVLVNAPNARTA